MVDATYSERFPGGRWMMTRIVHCDFCNADLADGGWDCPARDFDFDGPRHGVDSNVVVHGSAGSWLACDTCVALVQAGRRVDLFRRSLTASGVLRLAPSELLRAAGDLRDLHGQFWANRDGAPVPIDAAQVAQIATEPAVTRAER